MRAIGVRAEATLVVLVALAAGALPAVAHAGARADYRQMFTTPVPGASTGLDTQILYKNPNDPNAKPIPIRQEVFTFPKGTGFDNSVVPDCTVSEAQLELEGEGACPPESRVGGGEGTLMTGFPGDGERPLEVDGFDSGSGLLLLGGEKGGTRLATRADRKGRVVTVNVPRSPGGPPDGETAIRKVHNVFAAFTAGDRAYTRTPRVCPASGVWAFHAHLTFADGAVEDDAYEMPCQRDVTAPQIRVTGVPRHRCVARGFRVAVSVVDSSPLARVSVRLDRRRLRKTTASQFDQRVPARGLSSGRHRLAVVARDAAGNRSRRALRFRRCAGPVT
ncbi:MAG: hypothetical protein QOG63_1686 [Thermoleophilaceae bacterium]|jgi:hypothetical protein|nr:hypothetical protein [Thermoleophilaceae bacterium]